MFAAFASEEQKSRWFSGTSEWKLLAREFDFRVGGRERLSGRWPSGLETHFDCRFQNIAPDQRIVYVYNMTLGERLISVSLATIEFKPEGSGTRLIVTEQGAFLDGYDDAGSREHGTGMLLDRMAATLHDETAA